MVFKKKIMAFSISFLLLGCSTVENSYDSIVLEQTFDNGFTHTINNQNTLEDNKILLKSIQSDKNIMSMLKKNTKKGSPNYFAFQKYKALVDLIVLEENKKNKKNNILDSNTTKTSINKQEKPVEYVEKIETKKITSKEKEKEKKPESVKTKSRTQAKENNKVSEIKKENKKVEIKVSPEKTKPFIKEQKTIREKVIIKKDIEITTQVSNENLLKTEYLKIRSKLKNNHYVILSHCNVEDAHLLLEDIENYKNKVLSLSNNNIELAKYAIKSNELEFKRCLDLHFKNQSLINSDQEITTNKNI